MEKFFSGQVKHSQKKNTTQQEDNIAEDGPPKKFPKGVVLGKDGKP